MRFQYKNRIYLKSCTMSEDQMKI